MLSRLTMALSATSLFGEVIPVKLNHENGSFTGHLNLSITGTMNRAKAEWNGTITNTSSHKLFRAEFCVKALDVSSQQVAPGDQECIINLWGWNWAQGMSLNFNGKQDIKINNDKTPVTVSKFTVTVKNIFDTAPNIRIFTTPCPVVWPACIRVFADRKFRPTVVDKDTLMATYAYEGGRIDGYSASRNMLKSYTNANTAFFGPSWDSFRIDSASIYLRGDKAGECAAEIKMSFAGFAKQWYAVDSSYNFERVLLDEIGAQANQGAKADLDKAISQLPAEVPRNTVTKPQLIITSQPDSAEIEINGEFIGNTPTTVNTTDGRVTIKVTKAGYQTWERTLNLAPGDKRTIAVEMVK